MAGEGSDQNSPQPDQATLKCAPPDEKRHRHRVRIAVVILLCVLIPTIAVAVYPRIDVEIRVWYMEGMLGSISVDSELRNTGTVEVEIAELAITVLNSSGAELRTRVYRDLDVGPRTRYSLDNLYLTSADLLNDTSWSTFTIVVHMVVQTSSTSITLDKEFKTYEPNMSIMFSKRVSKWGL